MLEYMAGCIFNYLNLQVAVFFFVIFAGKQPISMDSVKTLMRRQSCRRMSHEVVPDHVHHKSQLKSSSFCDVYHISSNKMPVTAEVK